MVNATPGRSIAALILIFGFSTVAGAAALPEAPAVPTLQFTDLGAAPIALNAASEVTGFPSLPEPASTGLVCLGLAALAFRFGHRRRAA